MTERNDEKKDSKDSIVVVGLGYVGWPLALAFHKYFLTTGYDHNEVVIQSIRNKDRILNSGLPLTGDPESCIRGADFVFVTVPTGMNEDDSTPNLSLLKKAMMDIGQYMSPGVTVVVESTVYPGVTEDVCRPILENASGMVWKKEGGFHLAYSPERVNPGDPEHSLLNVSKVVAGDEPETRDRVAELYRTIGCREVQLAECIREAEAAKLIEVTQRDVNIGLVNELSVVINRLGLDFRRVWELAAGKWNFHGDYVPGLVGGHCTAVAPQYLIYAARQRGYQPRLPAVAREVNFDVSRYVLNEILKRIKSVTAPAAVGILGVTFKADHPDTHDTPVRTVVRGLDGAGFVPIVCDPVADPEETARLHGIYLQPPGKLKGLVCLVIAVDHEIYCSLDVKEFTDMVAPRGWIIDVKGILDREQVNAQGINYWRL